MSLKTKQAKQAPDAAVPSKGVYFNDGCIRTANYVGISAKLKGVDPDEYEFSRIYMHKSGRWGRFDLPGWNVVSMCHFSNVPLSEDDGWNGARIATLSERGQVHLATKGLPPTREQIADAESLGAVSQVRQIGTRLFVCGMQGQVYRRDDSGWTHIDQGILDTKISPEALHLTSIDGTSERNLYVCGFDGAVLEYDGVRWHRHSPPTNLHLERVLCVDGSVYFCGNEGTFFRMTNGGFEDFSIRSEDHFWGMAAFEGKIYLATLKGLHVFDGARVRAVRTGLKPEIGGYRLDARDGQLWSFGVDDLAWFDGKKWTRLKHPDNP